MSEVNFKPFNQNILVYAPVISETTKSGIVKSDKMIAEEKNKQDWFLEVAEVSDEITDIKVGDKVYIGSGKLPAIDIDGVQYIYVNKLSIVGKRKV
ncbi:MAG: hypothetical protein M0R17_04545 [Candidatus Omnitrophica bacterium]|jgi:co-chaperonin GroES (HSP10)|nr:hypothetical protein [Candidatus Omnitrophota bacterium]